MSSQERTEKATSRRRQKAQDQGQFAYSQEFTGALTLAAALTAVFFVYGNTQSFRALLESLIGGARNMDTDAALTSAVRQTGIYALMIVAPVLAAAVVAALVGNVLQGNPRFAREAGGLKWQKLNPIAGLSNLKTRISPIEWGKMLVLLAISGIVLWNTVSVYWGELITAAAIPLQSSNDLLRSMLLRTVTYLLLGIGVLAVADFFIQRWRFEKSIRQTKAEVKEDMKALEGNPTIKGKIRSIQRQQARRRMMARVKDADVIVTNPTHYAVALEYKPESMGAPRVIAKGQDLVAQKIKELGRKYDIPTVENVPLARALYRSVEVEQEIPAELYKAVAEVLAFVFKARNRR